MRDIDMGIQDKAYLNIGSDVAGGTSYMDEPEEEVDYEDERRYDDRVNRDSYDDRNYQYGNDPDDERGEDLDIDGPIVYMTDDDMELCEDDGCGDGMEEGMSSWSDADNEGGMDWSYMGDEYTEEEVDRLFDNTDNSDDIYGMNEPTPTKPTTKPDTDTPAPTRPSKNPFTPPSRIKPGEEPRPKADSDVDYMAAEPRPSQDPNEAPTIAPTKPDTDKPSRPSKNPFTPPSRIRPGEEPRPKAGKDVDYMDDEDVEFS
jgi:hypothetical protein